jgi:hypothetical protein
MGVAEDRPLIVLVPLLVMTLTTPAGGIAELGFVAAGLHLHFLDEVERRGVPSDPKTLE